MTEDQIKKLILDISNKTLQYVQWNEFFSILYKAEIKGKIVIDLPSLTKFNYNKWKEVNEQINKTT